MKRMLLAAVLLVLLLPATVAAAGSTKFTFNDVTFSDGTTGEIEASSKANHDGFTTCSYYSDDYQTYLGYFEAAGVSFGDNQGDALLTFCLDNFANREVH